MTTDSEVIPDIVVRQTPVPPLKRWDDVPTPILVAEVLSPSTERADLVKKRAFYMESGIPEYWIVDGEARSNSCRQGGWRDGRNETAALDTRWGGVAARVRPRRFF